MTTARAICRRPSASMGTCELTHLDRDPIDMQRVARQHGAYVDLLRKLGREVLELPALENHPDGVFVEDVALVLDEVAVICRPGAASRRGERASVTRVLEPYRSCPSIAAPGTLDGGDILRLGREIFVGLSTRSNRSGVEQLQAHVAPHGYRVQAVEVHACLHLKSAACAIGSDAVLLQANWIDPGAFGAHRVLETVPGEVGAANIVWLGESAIYASGSPGTAQRLRDFGLELHELEYDELAKAEGAVTCCSLLFDTQA